MNNLEFFNTALKKSGIKSFAQLATAIHVTPQTINAMKNGHRPISDAVIIEVARLIGEDPLKMLADYRQEVSKTETERKFWRGIAGAACVILSLWCAPLYFGDSNAYASPTFNNEYTLYVVAWILAALAQLRMIHEETTVNAPRWLAA